MGNLFYQQVNMTKHSINIRIYYEDTDAGGVVYHAQYLNFGERGRTELLRSLGHENSYLDEELGVLFVVRHIDIEYLKPAFLDDMLRLDTRIAKLSNTSFVMHQTLFRPPTDSSGKEEVIADMKVAIVCVDTNTIKPVRLPDIIKSEFEQFVE